MISCTSRLVLLWVYKGQLPHNHNDEKSETAITNFVGVIALQFFFFWELKKTDHCMVMLSSQDHKFHYNLFEYGVLIDNYV
jgi:hypothetical protein